MARAQQNLARRKRQRAINGGGGGSSSDSDSGGGGGEEGGAPPSWSTRAVLPVADLPDDFDGEVEDGATFLALSNRQNASLPFVKRVTNPYRAASPSPPPAASSVSHPLAASGPSAMASSSRHPALPKASWTVLFPMHFVGYRKHLADRWPPSHTLPYPADYPPLPSISERAPWLAYMYGHAERRRTRTSASPLPDTGAPDDAEVDEEAMMNGGSALDNGAVAKSEEEAALVVEALVNGEAVASAGDPGQAEREGGAEGEEDIEIDMDEQADPADDEEEEYDQEEEEDQPPEPRISVLQAINANEHLRLLSYLSHSLSNTFSALPSPLPSSPSPSSSPSSAPPRSPTPTTYDPLPHHISQWLFALLLVLPPHLSSNEISTLRELARTVMRIGAWRWVWAVTHGQAEEWTMGARWKAEREERSEMRMLGKDVEPLERRGGGVDETLGRCWMVVYAIAAGWGQRDLIDELEAMFT